ncbi:prepilin-type N-terminal cleavage/methylation domain-containing protein [Butyrivibrio hungatei DSM 14810]|uniref:Prepilin-type N-terminal cleavage/methylation domain-containing protein n=1 Tax=Butyrivibrio hungatei DSM 14810 TaxID=1121132 RepID=A0A1M7S7M0_9FIRM|nr:prepilin-type N-terminal cleavage/methylation domain-containing protein [Butyrivibrio hungatei]SHN54398.1 prepilin-type N-terminal cleavage/methylation domain-containing protein [Butyrivibrio hungatei DSM 14810]
MKGKLKIRKNKGFTLAELLIVVAIIAVLVAVSIPIFTGKLEKARIATTEANVRSAKAAAIADWMDTAKIDEDNFEESFLASAKKLLTFDLVVYAANSLCYEGSGVRVYVYDGEKNILVENSSRTPSISAKSGKLYTKVAVEINLETGAVRTNPYLTGTGENREVNTGFGTNSFEDEAEPEPSGGHGGHSG